MTALQRPGVLAVAIAGLALAVAGVSALLAWRAWQAGVPETPDLESGATMVQALLQLPCVVLTLVWLWRSFVRVRSAGVEGLTVGPWGAVLWWFVPLANLVLPAIAFAELRKAAIKPRDWQAADGTALIWFWWAFWLISGVATAVFLRAMTSDDQDLRQVAGPAAFASDLLGTPAALLFALVVLAIDRRLQALPSVGVASGLPSPAARSL